jgi:putative tryptophan/tyrosine transport system substrate-binding protein
VRAQLKRRQFLTLLGGAAVAWPLAASAQQPAIPVIGFLHLTSRDETRGYLPDFHRGLADAGYIEGKNVAIEYRWGEGHNDRLPSLIAALVPSQVSVIVTLESTLAALAAKEATQTIPIIFMQGADPVRIGLVDSLSHPGRNLTGINLFLAEVAAKRLEFLLVLVPGVRSVGYLRNPTNPVFAESETREVEAAARSFGVKLVFFDASDSDGIEQAFREIVQQRMDALFVSADGFLLTHSEQIVTLASWTAVPAAYGWRQAVTRGGLMSYGTDFHDSWRHTGIYTGRILKGEKPMALPVQQVTKVELCINQVTAKRLGMTVPLLLLGRADEVIE